jgi:hypothetical protein
MSCRCALIGAGLAAGSIFLTTAANATVTVNVTQSGSDVVATASGTLDLAGLLSVGSGSNVPGIDPQLAYIGLGTSGSVDMYEGLSGPSQFGSGGFTGASTSAGDSFAPFSGNSLQVWVPNGYVSGSLISSTVTFLGTSFASLGLTPGQYNYSSQNDSVIINVGQAASAVPEPSTWAMMLIGFGVTGLALRRRRRAQLADATA